MNDSDAVIDAVLDTLALDEDSPTSSADRPFPIPAARQREGRPVGLVPAEPADDPAHAEMASSQAEQALPAAAPATQGQAQRGSRLAALHAPYFVQQVPVGVELVGRPRVEVFRQICQGRRVLHVGCADWPITDVQASLHVQLDAVCAHLDGFDVHPEAFDVLRPHVRGRFFSRWEDIVDDYDLILVPEVMEHVPDVQGFLRQLDAVRAPHVVLTVPDASQCASRHFEYVGDDQNFVEVVHPDHNCWYSPYTLGNVIRKYTNWQVAGTWFFNRISLLAIAHKPTAEG